MERLVREVRFALHRRKREETLARRAVEEQMRSEMRETLTAMLLSCELAMAIPEVPTPAAEKNPCHRPSGAGVAAAPGGRPESYGDVKLVCSEAFL